MKRLITIVFLFAFGISYGQTFDSTKMQKNELYGQKHKRWQVDSQMIIPKTGDTTVKAPGQIKILSNTFMYTGQDRHWHIAGAGSTGTTSDTYTTAQVDSAIAANKVRFGIEDNISTVNRDVNLQGHNFTINNVGTTYFYSDNGAYSSEINQTATYISLSQYRNVYGQGTNIAGINDETTNKVSLQARNLPSVRTLEIKPNVIEVTKDDGIPINLVLSINGVFADSSNNIDLGTIGGSAGVTSFNSRSGAVVSQFADYSAYYQPIGRYIDSLRRIGTTVSGLINGAWIPQYTDSVGSGLTTETDPLSVHITDTSAMLSPYLRSANAAILYQPAGSYATTSQLALKVNISDTSSMLSPYLRSATATATFQPIGAYITANQPITVTATGDATGTSTSSSTAPSLPLVLASVTTAATVGSSTQIPVITYDAKGRITSTTTAAVTSSGGTVTGGSITWPGTIYSTPTTGSVTSGTLTFAPTLSSQSAYTILGNNTGSAATPSFFTNPYSDSLRRVGTTVSRRVNGNWIPQFTDSVGTGSSGGMAIGGTVTSGKTPSVLYIGTGGVLAQDTSYFKYDDVNKTLQLDSLYITEGKGRLTGNLAVGRNEPSTAIPLSNIRTGVRNTGLGASVLQGMTSGYDNTAFGYQALRQDTSGINNVAIGTFALGGLKNGSDNVAIGQSSLVAQTTGYSNVAIGSGSAQSAPGITNSTMLGFQAAQFASSGDNNVFIGQSAGRYANSLYSIGIGSNVSTIGGGTGKIAIGYNSGYSSTGDYTIYLGYSAGSSLTTGAKNIIIGAYNTGNTGITTGSSNVIIGSNVTGLSAGTSNTVILADGDGNKRIIVSPSGATRFGSLTNTQISAISGQTESDWVYSTTDHTYQFWNGTVWKSVITN